MVEILGRRLEESIKSFVDKIIGERDDLFIVDILKKGVDNNPKYMIILDGDHGITIDDCASISRQLSRHLDETIDSDSPYTLEVTSCGLDHPLTLKRQYLKNIGKNVKVTTNEAEVHEGKLSNVTSEGIVVQEILNKKKKTVSDLNLAFKDIKKTFVLVSFK